MKLDNATVFVSGANRGIGRALVTALLEAGVAKVYATARRLDSLDAVVAEAPDRVVPLQLDVTDPASVNAAAAAAAEVDLLVNNAGVLNFGSLFDADAEENFAKQNAVNVEGLLRLTRAIVPKLRSAAEAGRPAGIANLCSIVSFGPMPGIGHYSTTKATAWSLTKAMRQELGAAGISVHGIFPGPIDTDMAEDLPMQKHPVDATAKAIVAGIANGDAEIFPDPMAEDVAAKRKSGPHAVDEMYSAMG